MLNQHRWNLYIWIRIYNDQIIDPHFFEHIINGSIYLDFLQNYLPIYFEDISLDEAPTHYSQDVRIFLDKQYPNHWIGREGPVLWSSRSPNLNPLAYYL